MGFLSNNEGSQCDECYIYRKVLIFQNWTVVLGDFESYLLLQKSPEFISLIVLKYAYSAPTLTLPAVSSAASQLQRKSLDQIHI